MTGFTTAALSLFSRYGFEAVSLQMIADEVGLHKSSLFHHYRGKAALAHEVLRETMVGVLDCIAPLRLASESGPALDQLIDSSVNLSEHFAQRPEGARLLLAVLAAADDSDLRKQQDPNTEHPVVEFYQTVWRWLELAREAQAIRAVSVRQTLFNVIGLVLMYPAVAPTQPIVGGESPFSRAALDSRANELRHWLQASLTPPRVPFSDIAPKS